MYARVFLIISIITVLHTCSNYSSEKQHSHFAMYCFSLLVNSTTMEDLLRHLRCIKILFCSKTVNHISNEAHHKLSEAFQTLDATTVSTLTEGDVSNADSPGDQWQQRDAEEETVQPETNKPFGKYFEERMNKLRTYCEEGHTPNPLYMPQFTSMLLNKWLPICPLWTSLLRGEHVFGILNGSFLSMFYTR